MAAGKRVSPADPLTEHDVAERIDHTAVRLLTLLRDAREGLQISDLVLSSRYTSNMLPALAAELQAWGIEPQALV